MCRVPGDTLARLYMGVKASEVRLARKVPMRMVGVVVLFWGWWRDVAAHLRYGHGAGLE